MKNSYPKIFDIVKCSFVDGPGIRTVVFFKGCPLRCIWCHNPEAYSIHTEYFFHEDKCIQCENCNAGKKCFSLAKVKSGEFYNIDALIRIINEDKSFYNSSGGGVTLSGGEPLMFHEYVCDLIERLHKLNINICIQTSGYFNYDKIKYVLPYINYIYFDIKLLDSKLHEKFTGKSNKLILENFDKIIGIKSTYGIKLIPRTPLIPDITDTESNISAIYSFLKKYNIKNLEFMPYNSSGINKRLSLGMNITENIKTSL